VRREQGHGLLLALLVLVVMMTALTLLASSMRMGMLEDKRDFRTVSLIALSDAAMAETLAHLAENQAFRGVEEHEFGKGRISSVVRPLPGRRVEILVRASYAGMERRMLAWVSLAGGAPMVESWRRSG
jgi:hypothetical protein